jgi:WD40 repeat protein
MLGGIKHSCWLILLTALTAPVVNGGEHHTLRFHYSDFRGAKSARCLAISPDGTEVAICVDPGIVHFVRTKDGEIVGKRESLPFEMKYSKDGSRLLIFSTDEPVLLDTKTRQTVSIDSNDEPGFLGLRTVEKNGKLLVDKLFDGGPAARSGKLQAGVEIIGVSNGKTAEFESTLGMTVEQFIKKLQGPARTFVRVQVLLKGQKDPEIVLLQRQAGKRVGENIQFTESLPIVINDNLVPFQREGRHSFLSVADGKTVAALNTEDVQHVGQYAISPDQRRFAILSFTIADRKKYAFELYDLAKLERTQFFPFERKSFRGLEFSSDGKELLAVSNDRVDAFDADNGNFLRTYTLDGGLLTTFEDEDGPPRKEPTGGGIGSSVARASADRVGIVRTPRPQTVERIATSPKHLAVGAPNGTVALWDYKTGAKVTSWELTAKSNDYAPTSVQALGISQDGRWLVYYIQGTLNIVDVADLKAP